MNIMKTLFINATKFTQADIEQDIEADEYKEKMLKKAEQIHYLIMEWTGLRIKTADILEEMQAYDELNACDFDDDWAHETMLELIKSRALTCIDSRDENNEILYINGKDCGRFYVSVTDDCNLTFKFDGYAYIDYEAAKLIYERIAEYNGQEE